MVWCPLLFLHPRPFLSGLPLLRPSPLPVNRIHGSQSLGNLHLNIFPTQYLPPFFCLPRHMCTRGTTDLCPKEPWLVPIPNLAKEHQEQRGEAFAWGSIWLPSVPKLVPGWLAPFCLILFSLESSSLYNHILVLSVPPSSLPNSNWLLTEVMPHLFLMSSPSLHAYHLLPSPSSKP